LTAVILAALGHELLLLLQFHHQVKLTQALLAQMLESGWLLIVATGETQILALPIWEGIRLFRPWSDDQFGFAEFTLQAFVQQLAIP
jgi:hypothetical protein